MGAAESQAVATGKEEKLYTTPREGLEKVGEFSRFAVVELQRQPATFNNIKVNSKCKEHITKLNEHRAQRVFRAAVVIAT